MINTDMIQPTGRLLPQLRPRPGVRFGKPLDFSATRGWPATGSSNGR